jgi:fumarylacetoacetase
MSDPQIRRSFVQGADDGDFPLANLPWGAFRRADRPGMRLGVRIGDFVLDVSGLEEAGHLELPQPGAERVFQQGTLNAFLALGRPAWRAVRARLQQLLAVGPAGLEQDSPLREALLLPLSAVELGLPVAVGDYTDFYSSREHAHNVGTMLRGADKALMPNWLHLPVAYHGRASSVILDGTPLRRPLGQTLPKGAEAPVFGPSRLMDFELEVGFFLGGRLNVLGEAIPVERAEEHIFGLVLVNDWSARDLQTWEYQPLGPFLSKSFATTISPWIVTLDALEPFRCEGPAQEPEPLPYLRQQGKRTFDIGLEVWIRPGAQAAPHRVCRSNYRHLYWSPAQQLAHHAVAGCPMRPGDLLASGTISGPDKDSRGSLLELSWRGSEPLPFPGGETRTFLQDGDEVILRGHAAREGLRVGFGEARGLLLPAREV